MPAHLPGEPGRHEGRATVLHDLLAENAEGLVALSGCREGEIARRLRAGDREGARAVAEGYARMFGVGRRAAVAAGRRTRSAKGHRAAVAAAGFVLELSHHLLPDDDWLVAETAGLAEELGLPVVVTNDVHYALPEGRELQDVVTAIRHGRTLETLADLRRPAGEAYLKSAAELASLPPGDLATAADARTVRAWAEGLRSAGSWRRRARSSSASSAIAFRASPSRTGRRRSAISSSSATTARGAATTP